MGTERPKVVAAFVIGCDGVGGVMDHLADALVALYEDGKREVGCSMIDLKGNCSANRRSLPSDQWPNCVHLFPRD